MPADLGLSRRNRQPDVAGFYPVLDEDLCDSRFHCKGSGILGHMHDLYRKHGGEREGDAGVEGLKQAVLGWSSAYYIAYTLMMTIAFALLTVDSTPTDWSSLGPVGTWIHWRPKSEATDTVVALFYTVFCALGCYDSTWGMLLCAEWNVRGGSPPARVYPQFLKSFAASDKRSKPHDTPTSYLLQCCGPERSRHGATRCSCHPPDPFRRIFCCGFMGIKHVHAWDPFYFIDRTGEILCTTALNRF